MANKVTIGFYGEYSPRNVINRYPPGTVLGDIIRDVQQNYTPGLFVAFPVDRLYHNGDSWVVVEYGSYKTAYAKSGEYNGYFFTERTEFSRQLELPVEPEPEIVQISEPEPAFPDQSYVTVPHNWIPYSFSEALTLANKFRSDAFHSLTPEHLDMCAYQSEQWFERASSAARDGKVYAYRYWRDVYLTA